MDKLIEKYQKKFNNAIKNRNECLHEAIKTGNRLKYEIYDKEAFTLLFILNDLRELNRKPRIELNSFMEDHPEYKINSISVLNTEDYFPLDGDDL